MLNEKVASLLNEQINKEFYSAYLYLEFSAYFEDEGLDGFANWYKVQAQEERDHAMLMFQYLQNNSHRPVLEGIARPTAAPNGRLEVLKAGLAHEDMIKKMELDGDDAKGLYMLNSELAGRTYAAPSLVL